LTVEWVGRENESPRVRF